MIIPEWLFELPIIEPERNEISKLIETQFNCNSVNDRKESFQIIRIIRSYG